MIKLKNIAGLLCAASLLIFTSCNDDDDPKVSKPDAPVLNAASEITETGFKITWAAVEDADSYLLDVSLEEDFDPAITGYAKKAVTGTSHVMAGLQAETKYFFRLYAKDGSKISDASTSKNATTAAD